MASVKKKLKAAKFDPDVDLNIDFDSFEDVPGINAEISKKKSRSPVADVFTGTISGATSVLTDPQFIGGKVRKALPDQYGEAITNAENAARSIGSLYDETIREVKPQAARIAAKVDQLVPEERKKIKAVTKRISRFLGNEDPLPTGPSKEQRETDSINTALAGIFTRQEQINEETVAQQNAKDTVRDKIQDKRSLSMIDLLGRIDESSAIVGQYTNNVLPNYQKKSLELQYRSYFTQAELLAKSTQYFEIFKAQGEAIARNTALPEYRKIHLDERFRNAAKDRMVQFAQNKLMDPNGFVGRVVAHTKNEIKDYVQGFKDAMTGAEAMLGAYEQAKDLSEMGGDDPDFSKARLAGHVLGGGVADWLGDKGSAFVKKNLLKSKEAQDLGYKAKNFMGNLEGEAADFLAGDKAKELEGKDGFIGRLIKGVFGIGTRSIQAGGVPSGGKLGEFDSLAEPVFFDKRSKVSLEVVIPGLLSRILRENTMQRTGKDAELIKYDLTTGQFSGGSKIVKSFEKTLETQADMTGQATYIRNLVSDIQKDTQDRDVNVDREIGRFFSDISRKKGMRYTPDNIRKDSAFGNLSEEAKKAINRHFSTRIESGDDQAKEQSDFTDAMIKIRSSNANPEGEIKKMIDAGFAEELQKAGYISIDEYGNWKIAEHKFFSGIRDRGVKFDAEDHIYKKSDQQAKQGITAAMASAGPSAAEQLSSEAEADDASSGGKMDQFLRKHFKAALAGIRKSKVFNWSYRKGQGEDTEHKFTGPMAQDVNKNLGEGVSPTGKEIDMVSMNGANMLAIQELAAQQEEMMKDKTTKEILKGIYGHTSVMIELMKRGSGGGSGSGGLDRDGSYNKEFRNISDSLFTVAGKAAGDLLEAGKKTAAGAWKGVNMLGKGLKAVKDRYKDKFLEFSDWAIDNTIDMAKKGMEFGRDILTKHIPNALGAAGKLLKKLSNKAKEMFDGARDIYIPGLGLAIQGARLRAGEYVDSATGKVLRTIEDVQNAVGDIKDQTGAVVMSIRQRAQGLVDQFGIDIKVNFKSIRNAVIGATVRGVAKAGMKAWEILSSGKDIASKVGAAIKKPFKDWDGVGFGNKKIHNVLVQIRDLLTDKFGPIGEDYESPWKDAKESSAGSSEPAEPQYTGGSGLVAVGKAKKHIIDRFKKQPGDTRSFMERAKDTKDSILGKGKEILGGIDPDLKENLKERFSRGGKLFSKIPGVSKLKGKAGGLLSKLKDSILPASAATAVADELVEDVAPTSRQIGYDKSSIKAPTHAPAPVAGQLLLGYDRSSTSKDLVEDVPYKEAKTAEAEKAAKPQGRFAKLKTKAKGLAGKVGLGKGMLGKAGGLLKGAGGIAGGILGAASSLLGGGGESDPNDRVENPEDGKTEEKEVKAPIKRAGTAKATFNDRDGSGRRDGDSQDRREELEYIKAKRDGAAKAKASQDPKYMARESLLDGLLGKLGGLLSFAGGGLGKLFSGAFSLLGKGAGLMGRGLMGAGKLAAGGVRGLTGIGRGILSVGSTLARIPGVGLAARAVGMVRNAALVTGLVSGGGLGTIVGAVGGLMSVIASPVVLGTLAVAAVGYGAYKAYKYLTRDNVDPMEDIRMKQYGIGTGEADKKYNHYMLQLENYLLDGRVGFNNGQAYLLDRKVEADGLLEIMDIDKKDEKAVSIFNQWFQERFKPFFLTSCTAMRAVSDKVKLDKANSLNTQDKLKFLNLARFEGGPYDVDVSPFKELDRLNTDKTFAMNAVDALVATLKKDNAKGQEKGKPPAVPKVEAKADKAKEEIKKPYDQTDAANRYKDDKKKAGEKGKDNVGGEDGSAGEKNNVPELKSPTTSLNLGPVNEIGGPTRDGKDGMKYIRTKPGVKLNLHPEMLKNLMGMAQEYGEITGNSILVTDGSRTYEEQKRLYDADPKKAARPGFSSHEFGLAVDINSADANKLDQVGLMRKYGFTRPVGAEPWHVEPAGIQPVLEQAKKDPGTAANAIVSGLGRGGGGYGTLPGARKYGRDIEVAMGLLNQETGKKVSEDDINAVAKYVAPKAMEPRNIPDTQVAKVEAPAPAKTVKTAEVKTEKPSMDPEKNRPASDMAVPAPAPKSFAKVEDEGENKADADAQGGIRNAGYKWDTREDVKTSIMKIAQQNQTNPQAAVMVAAKESGLRPNARGDGSSLGLYQFKAATWEEQLGKNGKRQGIPMDTPASDPYASTAMYTEYLNQNLKSLKSVRENPSVTDAYLTHLLGPTGARKFLSSAPDAIGVNVLPQAAARNKEYFYQDGQSLTVKDIYAKVREGLKRASQEYGVAIDVSKDVFSKEDRPGSATTVASASAVQTEAPRIKTAATTISDAPGVKDMLRQRDMVADQRKKETPAEGAAPRESSARQQAREAFARTAPNTQDIPSSGRSVDPMVPLVKIADSQLSVSMEIRDILKGIQTSLSPDELKKLIGSAPGQMAGGQTPQPSPGRQTSSPQPQRPEQLVTSLDVSRKSRA